MKQTELGESYPLAEELMGELPVSLLFTTNRGLEFIVIQEMKERCREANLPIPHIEHHPFAYDGHVLVQTDLPFSEIQPVIFQMRSIEHVIQKLATFELPAENALNFIGEKLSVMDISGMPKAEWFRITSRRVGNHDFGSMDVQRVAGEVMVNKYGTGVNLNHPDLNVRVDVYDQTLMVGLQVTRQSLINRHNRTYIPRISLKPHVAYSLVKLAATYAHQPLGKVLDPFCGSGTILLEAAQCYPDLELFGSDLYEDVIEGARQNAQAAGFEDRIKLVRSDVFELDQVYSSNSFDAIITNPPFGIKLSKTKFFPNFYQNVLHQADQVLKPGGILVILSLKWSVLRSQVKKQGRFAIKELRKIETGGVHPRVFVLEKAGN